MTTNRRASTVAPPSRPTRNRLTDPGQAHGASGMEVDAVAGDLGPSELEEVLGRGAVAREEPVHRLGWAVAWCTRVDDQHGAARPAERERGGQAGGAAADHEHVDRPVVGR